MNILLEISHNYDLFSGYYCPAKTKYATEFPCPRGTFNNQTYRVSVDDCMPCTGGSYCETEGLSEPTALCNAGKNLINNKVDMHRGKLL